MPDDSYRLRRVPAPDAPSGSGRNNKSPANAVAADAAAIEDIIRRTLHEIQSAPGASTSNGNPTTSPPASAARPAAADSPAAHPASSASNTEDVASLRSQLSSLQKTYNEAIQALEQGRLAYQTLEHKHQQFVDANVAFTHWRDDMERQRAAWADANAKFAKRHEEHKAARANLEAKYSAVLGDLEELKERYERAKKEIERLSGQAPPPSPPLPSAVARPGDPLGPLEKRKKGSVGGTSSSMVSIRSVRGVERDASGKELHHRQPVYPPQLVEQSVLRERLTSDMFTLSQKVLEERASRAEEARQMAERRIFELESQLAGHPSAISPTTTTSSSTAAAPRSPPALQPSSSSPYHYSSGYAHSPRPYPPPGPPLHSPYPPPESPRDRDPVHHHSRYPAPPPPRLQDQNLPPPPALAPATIDPRRTLPPLPSPASSTWRSPGPLHPLPSGLPPPSSQLPPPLMPAHPLPSPPPSAPSRRRGRMDVGSLMDGDAEEAARRKKRRSDPYPPPSSSSGYDGPSRRTPGRSPP
ncbi:hypothetical protein FRC01_008985 [Tulasnella sp. 417]|nr:hypothetical protein FRC01_008985 [Tulasnella sp. 417]